MKPLYIRQQQTVADPLQSERLLKALTIILEHQVNRFMGCDYLDNVTLANLRLRKRRIAWAQAPSSLWEDPEFSETVRRNLPWHRATS